MGGEGRGGEGRGGGGRGGGGRGGEGRGGLLQTNRKQSWLIPRPHLPSVHVNDTVVSLQE